MGPAATTASGILAGLIVFLSMAMLGVIAVNGADNPGIMKQASASAAAGSSGDTPSTEATRGFKSLDLDGDGHLSLAEAAGYADIVTRFDRADRNRDGKLTPAEFERLAKLPPPKAGKTRITKREPRRSEATAAAGG
jgi:EF hand domain-containing protein